MSSAPVSNNSQWWIAPSNTNTNPTTSTAGTDDLSNVSTFLQLLSTELQNQDPTNPVSDTEYVSQMAQVNSLAQLQTIGNSINNSRAYELLGKNVTYQTTDSSTGMATITTGNVQAVVTNNNQTYLKVNGQNVSIDSVQEVDSSVNAVTG